MMKDYELKYGCNPNQKPAKIFMEDGSDLPIEILNGRPGYINLLDAMNSVLSQMTADDFNSMMDEAISVQPLSE